MLLALSLGGGALATAETAKTAETAANQQGTTADNKLPAKVFADWLLQDAGPNHQINFDQPSEKEKKLVADALADCRNPPTVEMDRLREAYLLACQQRRRERLQLLAKSSPRFVFVKQRPLSGSFYGYTEGQSDAQNESNFRPGGELCVWSMDEAYGSVTTLLKDPGGVIRDPELSFDAKRLLFSWKRSHRQDDYHLYEMDLDSRAIRQLTHGLGFADYEGRYLPDGDIVFSSTRGISTIPCWWTEASNLWRCDKDGKFMHRLGYDQVTTNFPSLLDDGRIIYTRWDYNDRGQTFPQPLFVMNPDGTKQISYYGLNSWFPTTINHAREIPGSGGKLIAILHGHHTHQKGKLALVDRSRGVDEGRGVTMLAPVREATPVIVDAYGQKGDQFQYPYPLSEDEFLVTYDPLPGGNRAYPRPFGIYWMNASGERELLASDDRIHCKQAFPLVPRKMPRAIPSIVDHRKSTARVFMQNVYAGHALKGVKKGAVKKIRVVEMKLRAAGVGSSSSSGPHSRAMISTPVAVGNGSWDAKMILGDVPVHEDGSAYFEVPAKRPIYFQALDEKNRAINTMRTWATLMPGEMMSCVGCHDKQHDAPVNLGHSLALRGGLQSLKPFYGPARGFSYAKEIQPIWDAKCVSCHDGQQAISLKATARSMKKEKRLWAESYLNLLQIKPSGGNAAQARVDGKYVKWLGSQSEPTPQPAYLRSSINSPLIKLLENGHHDVRMTREEMDKISAWIDLYVPYSGQYPEAGDWNKKEKKKYAHFQAKRDYMREFDRLSRQALIRSQGVSGKVPENRETEYFAFSRQYAPESVARFEQQLVRYQAEMENTYRNLAYNPDARPEAFSYPHASSNSECRGESRFLAGNAIDGDRRNTKHQQFPSWGPDRADHVNTPWIKLDFGREVEVDKAVLLLRADFPHDTTWQRGRLDFSDGSHIDLELKATADAQSHAFPKRTIRWVKFTGLDARNPEGWAALSEIELWGRHK
ncbi:hypothetical protein HW115_14970 [Verrucomicrobiaceae bacterium N1E253]|uniref:Hydrazine synthase alpha subunit middle domain-containing protein n=1 Tax=Oceaniferula marina TaxID=2748318 RepID=A0A851GRS8_9BACT|nr:discoidin domain-containing protein [Oceaniferula marina]NWK56924.1 hypothetical protein [Oceaniferula marina]